MLAPFQLDNLLRQKVPFLLLQDPSKESVSILNPHYLEKVKIVEVGKMEATVDEVSIDKHHPAILVSQPEKRVHKVANSLIDNGYVNVYVLEGGLIALIEHYKQMIS